MKKRASIVLLFLAVFVAFSSFSTMGVAAAKKVKISKTKMTINVQQSKQLSLVGAKGKITWSSSNKKIASVDKYGMVRGKKEGKAIITAKNKGKKYRCTVKVKENPKINTNSLKMAAGTLRFVSYSGTNKKITWTSTNKEVATISKRGGIQAKKIGTTSIILKAGKKKDVCKLRVVKNINLGETDVIVENGKTIAVKSYSGVIKYEISDPTVVDMQVKSPDELMNEVDIYFPDGVEYGPHYSVIFLYGLKNGTATIKLSTDTNDEIETINVTVKKPENPTSEQKLIDYIINNSQKANSIDLSATGYMDVYDVEEGYRFVLRETGDKDTNVVGIFYFLTPASEQIVYVNMEVKTNIVDMYLVDSLMNKVEVLRIDSTDSIVKYIPFSADIDKSTYNGEDIDFKSYADDITAEQKAEFSAGTIKTLREIEESLLEKAGLSLKDLGFVKL